MRPSWVEDDDPDVRRIRWGTRICATVAFALLIVSLAFGTRPADSHLPRVSTPKMSRAETHAIQSRNLYHARYVCERGARKHRRWACTAANGWLRREWRETRPVDAIPAVWYAIAVCESSLGTGRPQWHINTGNGFYGGLQFLTSTWLAYGGGRYAPRADLATAQQQVAVASTMSLTHWPHCGAPYR